MKEEIEKLVEWIREYVESASKSGVVIGLSGGVDSAVTAALAVRALGREKVSAVTLPCKSKEEDTLDANVVARSIGINVEEIDLQYALEEMRGWLGDGDNDDAVVSNIKSRLRMTALYAVAQDNNSLVIGTTNKSESMLGYYTKYGDGGVDFEPLLDFYKTEVIDMARELGLPEEICTRTPSPGLQAGVTDESEIGMPYGKIDLILSHIDGGCTWDDRYCCDIGFTEQEYSRIRGMIDASEHKRAVPPSFKRRN